ncbi:MAG: hypothetical protein K0R39_3993 [Symbiobacteriaceae bacterium]|jgi:hypothetical protein|nr:hypothetical protein [Symbiobacteriaceae bacterium]
MTQNVLAPRSNMPRIPRVPALSLRQAIPSDWHHDRPAYAGDPDMDWINLPEPPREPRWGLKENQAQKN